MTCEHSSNEDCLICTNCGECNESLNESDICSSCQEKVDHYKKMKGLFAAYECGKELEKERIAEIIVDALTDHHIPLKHKRMLNFIAKNFPEGQKISAIKYVREQTGMPLKEAKEFVERLPIFVPSLRLDNDV